MLCKEKKQSQGIAGMKNIQARSLYFSNYESMITYLQESWKIYNKVTYSSGLYYNFFRVDKLKFLVGVSISNSQKLIEWVDRKVLIEGYNGPEKHSETIQHN